MGTRTGRALPERGPDGPVVSEPDPLDYPRRKTLIRQRCARPAGLRFTKEERDPPLRFAAGRSRVGALGRVHGARESRPPWGRVLRMRPGLLGRFWTANGDATIARRWSELLRAHGTKYHLRCFS
jgi:hypothetical protein